MGHAAFERAQEDINEYHEWLKEEEALWAAMASCVEVSYKSLQTCMVGLLRVGGAQERLELTHGQWEQVQEQRELTQERYGQPNCTRRCLFNVSHLK